MDGHFTTSASNALERLSLWLSNAIRTSTVVV